MKKNVGICVSVEGRLLNKFEIITSFSDSFLFCNASPSMAFADAGENSANAKLAAEISHKWAERTKGRINFATYFVKFSASKNEAKKSPAASPVKIFKRGLKGGNTASNSCINELAPNFCRPRIPQAKARKAFCRAAQCSS